MNGSEGDATYNPAHAAAHASAGYQCELLLRGLPVQNPTTGSCRSLSAGPNQKPQRSAQRLAQVSTLGRRQEPRM